MARKEQFTQSRKERQYRYFSESFKRRKVDELDRNLTTLSELSKEYQVSKVSIYRWIYKYSAMRKKGERQVVETESDTKKLLALQEKIKELERIVGQKQMLIDFQDKVIELAEDEYKVNIKKKFGDKPSSGTGTTDGNTPIK